MSNRVFRIVCFVLAIVFTVVAIRGMLTGNVGLVPIMPALVAVALVIVGIRFPGKEVA